jgi:hypothetical protein
MKSKEPESMRRRKSRARQAVELSAGAGAVPHEQAEQEPEVQPEPEPEPSEVTGFVADEAEPAAGLNDQDAIAYWRNAVLRDSTNVMARRRLARTLEHTGASLLAVEQLEAAHAVQP